MSTGSLIDTLIRSVSNDASFCPVVGMDEPA
jgi:hypothetical protein